MSERVSSHTLAYPGEEWTVGRGQGEGTTYAPGGLHVTSGLDEPSGLERQWADSASFYSLRGSAMAASAFAITASARSIVARNAWLFQVSTEWPSSNDSSVAPCARETNSRSAAMASASSLASAPFREDCVTSITPSHRNFGPPCSIVTNDDSRNCPLVIAVKRDSAAPSLALVLALAGGHPDEGASTSRFQPRWRRSNRAIASGCAAICRMRGHRLACSDRTTSSLQRASPSTLERLCSGGPSTLESASCGAAPDVPHDAIPHLSSTSQRRPGFATKGPSRTRARVRGGVRYGVLMAYGRCLRPALYSSLRSSPSHPTGVSALRVTIAIANARKQWGLRKSTAKSRRLFRNESATIQHVRAGANGRSTAMTRTAFCRKSPRVPRVCWLGSSNRENTRAGRRDKRGSPVGPQAIDMAWVLACRSVGARAAPCVFMNAINDNFGTVAAFDGPEAWQ